MHLDLTKLGLRPGESISLGHYTVTYEGSEVYVPPKEPDKTIFLGHVLVSTDGGALERMSPYREVFRQGGGLLPPALRSNLAEDLYILFLGEEGGFGSFKVFINPLVNWVWSGGVADDGDLVARARAGGFAAPAIDELIHDPALQASG